MVLNAFEIQKVKGLVDVIVNEGVENTPLMLNVHYIEEPLTCVIVDGNVKVMTFQTGIPFVGGVNTKVQVVGQSLAMVLDGVIVTNSGAAVGVYPKKPVVSPLLKVVLSIG